MNPHQNQRIPSFFDMVSPDGYRRNLDDRRNVAPRQVLRRSRPPMPRTTAQPNPPRIIAGIGHQSCFVSPSLPWACLPFCGGGDLSLPDLSSGRQHGPTYIPRKCKKARGTGASHPADLAITAPLAGWLWLCHLTDNLAPYLIPQYHDSTRKSRGKYPKRILCCRVRLRPKPNKTKNTGSSSIDRPHFSAGSNMRREPQQPRGRKRAHGERKPQRGKRATPPRQERSATGPEGDSGGGTRAAQQSGAEGRRKPRTRAQGPRSEHAAQRRGTRGRGAAGRSAHAERGGAERQRGRAQRGKAQPRERRSAEHRGGESATGYRGGLPLRARSGRGRRDAPQGGVGMARSNGAGRSSANGGRSQSAAAGGNADRRATRAHTILPRGQRRPSPTPARGDGREDDAKARQGQSRRPAGARGEGCAELGGLHAAACIADIGRRVSDGSHGAPSALKAQGEGTAERACGRYAERGEP